MPAPLQQVHVHVRRVGQLQEEQLLAGDLLDPGRIRAAGQDVETVDAQAERRMVGRPDDVPGPLVGVDMRSPGQGLVGHQQPALLRQDGGLVQLLGNLVVVVGGVRMIRRTHQDLVGAHLLHDVEFAFDSAQIRREAFGPHTVQVTERLVQVDRQAEIGAPSPAPRRPTSARRRSPARRSPRRRTRRPRRRSSLSSSVPEMQTVAMAVRNFGGAAPRPVGAAGSLTEVAAPGGIHSRGRRWQETGIIVPTGR